LQIIGAVIKMAQKAADDYTAIARRMAELRQERLEIEQAKVIASETAHGGTLTPFGVEQAKITTSETVYSGSASTSLSQE
jgi:P2-related tail formation protein